MSHRLGVSGSTIMSDPEHFHDLFWEGITHVEIGEFPNEEAFEEFLRIKEKYEVTFGVHAPIYRAGSKYDWLEKVNHEPEYAWKQLDQEMKLLSRLGAEYILIHFPYFKGSAEGDAETIIEKGLMRLSALQEKHHLPIVCEPKLGLDKSSKGINYLHDFPVEKWNKYGLELCIDIGDYSMATDNDVLQYIQKWKDFIKVVHLHNVDYQGDKYIWTSLHPSQEGKGQSFVMEPLLKQLALSTDVFFILEHTPHLNPGQAFVEEGARWIKDVVGID